MKPPHCVSINLQYMYKSNGEEKKNTTGKCEIFIQERSANLAPGREEVVEVCAQPGGVLVGLNAGGSPLEVELKGGGGE